MSLLTCLCELTTVLCNLRTHVAGLHIATADSGSRAHLRHMHIGVAGRHLASMQS